jgi:hypothetical protein
MRKLLTPLAVWIAALFVLTALIARDYEPGVEWVTINLPDPPTVTAHFVAKTGPAALPNALKDSE